MKIPDAVCDQCGGRVKYLSEPFEAGMWWCLTSTCRALYDDTGTRLGEHGLTRYTEDDGTKVTL